jgi:hypothetical protein
MKRNKNEINPWSVKRGAEFGMGRKVSIVRNKKRYNRKQKHIDKQTNH